ncbi:hypothetical protein D5F01_LYC23783 [Larimichthys crocea]|uniref:PiggyBac transposable element-derived protein domain-containing protein n=1 Tax=Larimichthys crocea TaxID=215358 RepID=A0A6G0HGD5_LARCR|nr:hypothetical protein D5F01_LYC23783 [Larimichthys crocea]
MRCENLLCLEAAEHTLVSYVPRRGKKCAAPQTPNTAIQESATTHKRKPTVIQDYKRCKGGVDNLDKVVGTYSVEDGRIGGHWPFFTAFSTSHLQRLRPVDINQSILEQKGHRRRLFIEEVGDALVTPHVERRERLPRSSAAAALVAGARSAAAERGGACGSGLEEGPGGGACRRMCRRMCDCCRKRKVGSTCCKCGRFICKAHSLILCSLCST